MQYFTYTTSATLQQAISILDLNGNGFLPVIDVEGKLYGVITDGDLRRGLLKNELTLDAIINKEPIVESTSSSEFHIKMKLNKMHLGHMPIVDDNGKLVNVISLNEFDFISKPNKVVIMAGGIGSRLGDLTKFVPKPMLRLGGKPILEGIIENFKSQGFTQFVLCVNYRSEVIEEYFGNGKKLNVEISYTKENQRLGTAGALTLISEKLTDPFIVVNGDVLTDINFEPFLNGHIKSRSKATMCIKKYSNKVPYACVEYNDSDDLIGLKEKPSYDFYINTGMYILEPDVINYIPKDSFFDMPELFDLLMKDNLKIKVYKTNGYWLDIGRPSDFEQGKTDYKV